MQEFTERPTKCAVCGGPVVLVQMKEVGLKPYGSGYCYVCLDCGRFIVTHKHHHLDAVGTIADRETKALRYQCHKEFDTLWDAPYERSIWYNRLARKLGIRYEDCHFGHMDKEMLKKALDCIKELKSDK